MTVIQRVNFINWDNFHFQDFSTLTITTRQSPLLQSSASKLKLNIKVQMANLEWAKQTNNIDTKSHRTYYYQCSMSSNDFIQSNQYQWYYIINNLISYASDNCRILGCEQTLVEFDWSAQRLAPISSSSSLLIPVPVLYYSKWYTESSITKISS